MVINKRYAQGHVVTTWYILPSKSILIFHCTTVFKQYPQRVHTIDTKMSFQVNFHDASSLI